MRKNRNLEARANRLLGITKTRESYHQNMSSERWKRFKWHYWSKYKRQCAACESTEKVILHHTHYNSLGRERIEDVVPLCFDCHSEFHNLYGVNEDMISDTIDFIISKRNT